MHQYWQFTDPNTCNDIWKPLATCPFLWPADEDVSAALLAAGYRPAAEVGYGSQSDENDGTDPDDLWFSAAPNSPAPAIALVTFPDGEVATVVLTTVEDVIAYSCWSGSSNVLDILYALATDQGQASL